MAPNASNFLGVGRTLDGRKVQPKGARALKATEQAEYRPYNESEGEDEAGPKEVELSEIDRAEIQALYDELQSCWSDDSDLEDSCDTELQREIERRVRGLNKSDAINKKYDENTQRRGLRFQDIFGRFSKEDKKPDIVDAHEQNNTAQDPTEKSEFVPCLNGGYEQQADGSFKESTVPRNIYPCGCRVCRHRRKNYVKRSSGTLRSGRYIHK